MKNPGTDDHEESPQADEHSIGDTVPSAGSEHRRRRG